MFLSKEKILKTILIPFFGFGLDLLVTLNNGQEISVKNPLMRLEYIVEVPAQDICGNPIIKKEKRTRISDRIILTIPKDLSEEERNHPRYKVLYLKEKKKLHCLEEYATTLDKVSIIYIEDDYCIIDLKNGDRVQGYIDCCPLPYFDADKWEIKGEDPSSVSYIKKGKKDELKSFYEKNNIGYMFTWLDTIATIFIPFSEIRKIEPKSK